jgi:hypothetical protein
MQDQACLYGLPQSHLVREQHPRRMAAGHFMGDVELMRDEAGAGSRKAVEIGCFQPFRYLSGALSQDEPLFGIDLTGEEPVGGTVQLHEVVEFPLRQFGLGSIVTRAAIGEQSFAFGHRVHLQ